MKKTVLLIFALLATITFSFAQVKGKDFTPAWFYINLEDRVVNSVIDAGTTAVTAGLSAFNASDQVEVVDSLSPVVIPMMYQTTVEAFKNELDINLLPLNTLENKINYDGEFPSQKNLSKAAKKAPGQDFYFRMFVYTYKPGLSVGLQGVSASTNIKPAFDIEFELADAKGKTIDDISIKKVKSDVLINPGYDKEDGTKYEIDEYVQLVANNLNEEYKIALAEVIADFKKSHKKEYK